MYICDGSDHFANECNKTKVLNFLENVKDETIDQTINTIDNTYVEILRLKYLIQETNKINLDDLPEIIKESIKKNKINNIIHEIKI